MLNIEKYTLYVTINSIKNFLWIQKKFDISLLTKIKKISSVSFLFTLSGESYGFPYFSSFQF